MDLLMAKDERLNHKIPTNVAQQYIQESNNQAFIASLKEKSSYRQAQNEGKAITE
ncbi:12113_t:CDS:2, partial [Gigaspora margarita]